MKANCFHCHGGEGEPKSGLDVRLRKWLARGGEAGPAITPGNRGESPLYERTLAGEMPPSDNFSAADIETIGRWIDAGTHNPSR